tara:strand:+ start:582 stop:1391 length:810 start_codon:yes stop_codon:yes gene_type:complete
LRNNKIKKIVVISGGMGFLGKQYVEELSRGGFSVVILDIVKNSTIQKYVKYINSKYESNASGYLVDITNEKKISLISKKIKKKYGKIDVLINNAANNPTFDKKKFKNKDKLENFSLKNWNLDISVGLTGSFICSKYFGSIISLNKKGGSILNISSDLGLISPDHRIYNKNDSIKKVKPISYSVVKTGVIGLTKYLATYWPGIVRSNALCLGGVYFNQDKDFVKKVSKLIPLGRMATANEYSGIIKFLCSDESSYLNGAIIPVDGGRTVW